MTNADTRVDQTTFRTVMADVCTPVAVVTALDGDRPHGTTVSAFSSLSLEPPMLVMSLARTSDLLALLGDGTRFGVNVLARDQAVYAVTFAGKGEAKFDGVSWSSDHGAPRIRGCAAWLVCEARDFFEGGDHMLVLGIVLAAESHARAPLTYHSRVFGTHAALCATPQ